MQPHPHLLCCPGGPCLAHLSISWWILGLSPALSSCVSGRGGTGISSRPRLLRGYVRRHPFRACSICLLPGGCRTPGTCRAWHLLCLLPPAHGLHAEGVVRSWVSCPNLEPLFLHLPRWGCGLLAPQLLSFYPWSCPSICALPRSAPHPNRCSQHPGRGLPDSEAGVGLSQASHGAALPSRGGAEGRVLRPGGLQLWPAAASGRPGAAQRGCRPILVCPWLLSGGTDLKAGSFPPCVCWDCPCRLTADISLRGTLDPGLDPDPWCSWSCHVSPWACEALGLCVAPGMLSRPPPAASPRPVPHSVLQRHLCRGVPRSTRMGGGRAVSRLSDGNFVFHLIQKIMMGDFPGDWVLCFPPMCRRGLRGV